MHSKPHAKYILFQLRKALEFCLLKNTITIYRLKWELYNVQCSKYKINHIGEANIVHNQQICL